MPRLALFDIDCTLIAPHNAGGRAIVVALRDVYGVSGSLDGYSYHGRTDPQIIRELVALWGNGHPDSFVDERLEQCLALYTELLREEVAEGIIEVLPGVGDLVRALSCEPDVSMGLLTGNILDGARIKLGTTDFAQLFEFGAYGSDSAHRPDLPAIAVARAEALTGYRFSGKEIAIIGDTPADITCGASLGVKAIGVATGKHTRAELAEHAPDYLFDDLSDWRSVAAAVLA